MNGFLFDENLPSKIQFTPSLPIIRVSISSHAKLNIQRHCEWSAAE